MQINRQNIKEIVTGLGLYPDKDLGQNFLVEEDVSSKIVDFLNASSNDHVLEVGPGLGSISHYLIGKSDQIDVVDIDDRMCNFLGEIYKNNKIKIINSDVRKIDISNYTKIIGNLPYYITTELVTFLLEKGLKCSKFVFMVQSEASCRFLETSGENYGAISVLINLLGKSKKDLTVKPSSFYPMPKCNSTVFEIEIMTNDREKCLKIYKMCKQLFLNRRKTILNNLKNYIGDKEKAENILMRCSIPENKRPEQISPIEYEKLYDSINNYL